MNHQIDSPRLLCGILSELEVSETLTLVSSQDLSSFTGMRTIKLELRKPYENSELTIDSIPSEISTLSLEAAFQHRKITFCVERIGLSSFKLPSVLHIVEGRASPRLFLADNFLPAEIRTKGSILLGSAYDINAGHISILVERPSTTLEPGDSAEILFRSPTIATDMFFNRCRFVTALPTQSGQKLLFKHSSDHSEYRRRPPRRATSPATIRFSSVGIPDFQIHGTLIMNEVSLTGFRAKVEDCPIPTESLLGMRLESESPHIAFYGVRVVDDAIAFQIAPKNSEATTRHWLEYVQKSSSPKLRPILGSRELSNLLTESTFLKGTRRETYGKSIDKHLVHTSPQADSALCRRFCQTDNGRDLSHHLSTFRLADSCWFIQEGATGIYRNEGLTSLKDVCLSTLSSEALHLSGAARFLSGVFDPSVKVNWKFWGDYINALYLPARHLPTTSPLGSKEASVRLLAVDVNDLAPTDRHRYTTQFLPTILNLLDYNAYGWPNRLLMSLLAQLGPGHSTTLQLLYSPDHPSEVALAYRVKTHYSANVSGMLNSVFVFTGQNLREISPADILHGVLSSPDLHIGTQDILIVGEASDGAAFECLERKFQWFSLDLRDLERRVQ